MIGINDYLKRIYKISYERYILFSNHGIYREVDIIYLFKVKI